MSRIDQAMRIWEGGKGQPEPEAPERGNTSALNEYHHEQLIAPAREEPASFEASAKVPVPAINPRRTQPRPVKPRVNADLQARLISGAPSTAAVEQYRRLAAVLHDEQVQSQLKALMITSALPHEGKTLTVANLALTLTESYARRVLVIDADLRCPSLHTVLGIPNGRGLSEAITDSHLDLPIVEVSDRLSVLTAGKPGPSPLAGLTSTRMGEVVQECSNRFDWVLIDTSPVGVLTDAQVLARLVGAVILVVGAGSTPSAAVERAISELGGPEAILGVALNRVEDHRIPEANYYEQYQSYFEK